MPLRNLAAWFVTGLAFIGASRLLWRDELPPVVPVRTPLAVYIANCAFAAVLSASVGLWQPIPLCVAFALAPTALLAGAARVGPGRLHAPGHVGMGVPGSTGDRR